jgi:signal transduction histidine kinase
VDGHPLLLERVVRNLVVNAQEAVLDGGITPPPPVELVLYRDDTEATLQVLDRGPGLPPGTTHRIWDPEFTTRRKGTGLGLALVRQGVVAHGGRVEAMDREGGGAEFRIHLPLAPGGAP